MGGQAFHPKVFKEVIVHYFLNYAYGWGWRENPRIFIGHSENYCKMCLVWLLVDLGMAVRSIHNFFSFLQKLFGHFIAYFCNVSEFTTRFNFEKGICTTYIHGRLYRILSIFYYDYIYIWLY